MSVPELRVLIGPTAGGKSSVAQWIAEQEQGQILLVDSMQIYKELDIGTAKPSAEECKSVPRRLMNWKEPHETCSVAKWLREADKIILECIDKNIPLIAEGGTALYLKALREGLFEGPGRDDAIRQELENEADEKGLEVLYERLKEIDPKAYEKILSGDRRRIIRALEVYKLTGKPTSEQQTQWGKPRDQLKIHFAMLNSPRDALYARIDRRIHKMIDNGWVEECRTLLDRDPPLSHEAKQALGYRTLFAHLNGEIELEKAVERICFDTHHFARRQFNWYRKFPDVHVVEISGENLTAIDESPNQAPAIIERLAKEVLSGWPSLP